MSWRRAKVALWIVLATGLATGLVTGCGTGRTVGQEIPPPVPVGLGDVMGITGTSARDLWLWESQAGTDVVFHHFDGSAWSVVPSPPSLVGLDSEVQVDCAPAAEGAIWVASDGPLTLGRLDVSGAFEDRLAELPGTEVSGVAVDVAGPPGPGFFSVTTRTPEAITSAVYQLREGVFERIADPPGHIAQFGHGVAEDELWAIVDGPAAPGGGWARFDGSSWTAFSLEETVHAAQLSFSPTGEVWAVEDNSNAFALFDGTSFRTVEIPGSALELDQMRYRTGLLALAGGEAAVLSVRLSGCRRSWESALWDGSALGEERAFHWDESSICGTGERSRLLHHRLADGTELVGFTNVYLETSSTALTGEMVVLDPRDLR